MGFTKLSASVVLCGTLLSAVQSIYLPDVTPKTWDKVIDPSKTHVLLEFYAPWCGHCKALAPEFEQLGKLYASNPSVTIAQVDADKHAKLGKKFNVQGFPTMKWISKGKTFKDAEDVNERTADGLIKFVGDKTGIRLQEAKEPSSVLELSPSNFDDEALDEGKVALVGFFAPWCGHCKAIKPVWEELAKLFEHESHVVIGAMDADKHKDLGEKYEVTGFPTLKLFGLGSGEPIPYAGARELDALVEFVNEHAGTDLTTDGGVAPGGGVVHEIKEHLEMFKKAETAGEKEKAIQECAATVDGLDERTKVKFSYYERMLKKVMDKGDDYVTKEKKRLSGMLESSGDSLQAKTRRMFMRRVNVLTHFDEL